MIDNICSKIKENKILYNISITVDLPKIKYLLKDTIERPYQKNNGDWSYMLEKMTDKEKKYKLNELDKENNSRKSDINIIITNFRSKKILSKSKIEFTADENCKASDIDKILCEQSRNNLYANFLNNFNLNFNQSKLGWMTFDGCAFSLGVLNQDNNNNRDQFYFSSYSAFLSKAKDQSKFKLISPRDIIKSISNYEKPTISHNIKILKLKPFNKEPILELIDIKSIAQNPDALLKNEKDAEELSQADELLQDEKDKLSQDADALSQDADALSQDEDALSQDADALSQADELLQDEKDRLSQDAEELSQNIGECECQQID